MDLLLFYILSPLVNALVATILGFVVYFRNRKELLNKVFSLFCGAAAIWAYSYFVWFLLKDKNLVLLNHRIFLMGASTFIAILFFHSVLAFTNKIRQYKNFLTAGYIIFSIFLLICWFTPFIVRDVEPELFFEFWPKAGILLPYFLAAWYFYFLLSGYIIFKEAKRVSSLSSKTDVSYRAQLKYILVGGIIGLVGSISNYFLWYGIPIPPIANFFVAVGMIIVAYGIVKHRLFNIKLLISELLVFSIWIIVVARTALSNGIQELVINGILAVLVFVVGVLLMRSVSKEVEIEKIELKETQRNLDIEQRLRKTFAEIAEEQTREIEKMIFKQ
ncbi:MAG: histidine kinase N-terminal 7TM domain-containing protein [Candidatus Staskawiczbacteria bacterium]|nr:histidine kinase N-terminal 7TM domain-containing protein [Candidatus Staskawiczbacteria bacterium]